MSNPILQVKPAAVLASYNGGPGCMCGCNGDWVRRGDPDFSLSKLNRRINKINKIIRERTYDELDITETYIYVGYGTRTLAVYFE